MTQYREILRLNSLDLSERSIAASAGVSRNTVSKVLKRAKELNISWPLDHDMTDSVLEEMLFPKDNKTSKQKRLPDFDYIRNELLRNGVNKKLLCLKHWVSDTIKSGATIPSLQIKSIFARFTPETPLSPSL